MSTLSFIFSLFVLCSLISQSQAFALSSRLIHRFSDEARAVAGFGGAMPTHRSSEYYRLLARSDLQRQKKRINNVKYQSLFPAEGSDTFSLGNDFGWLHYTWIDIGTPNVSFLVALDAGSDLLWVPCDCIQCAPLSGNRGGLDKDLGMYNPAKSGTSRHLSCSHELCVLGTSCKSPKQPCPYTVDYYTENTSSSGLLVEDVLYLATSREHMPVQTPIIVGCGRRQSGVYLDGIAPDGVLGLGFGNISVPSILARSGLVHNSFSMCFRDDDSGQIFFGDQGVPTQQSTPFVPSEGKYITYIVEVESFCIKNQCLRKTSFQALVDTGSSFSVLPQDVYKEVTLEFDRQINASRFHYDSDWDYCYKASPLEIPIVPTLTLLLAVNKSFAVTSPVFLLYGDKQEIIGFCLALQSSSDSLGTIGQNLMKGYQMVFDRDNLKLGWSHSNCKDIENSRTVPLTPPPPENRTENPLPTNEQQSSPNAHAVSPAVAGRAPTTIPSTSSPQTAKWFCSSLLLLAHLIVIFIG